MLDRAGNTHRDIQLRRDDLAGLPDLIVVRHKARIHRRPAGTHRRTQRIGNRVEQGEIIAVLHATAARNHHPRGGQFRPLALGQFRRHEPRHRRARHRRHRLNRGAATFGRHRIEARRPHRDYLLGVAALHRRHRVAGINRPHESIGIHHAGNIADRLAVEQRGHARHDVLAHRRRRGQQMRIAGRERNQQRRHRLGQRVGIGRIIGQQHLGHTRQLARRRGGGLHALAGHQHMHLAELRRRSHRGTRRLLDDAGFVVQQYQNGHDQITFASVFNLATNSATEPTFTPACRFGGSATETTVSRGVTSTPSSSGFTVSIGFLRAFMMFGSDA